MNQSPLSEILLKVFAAIAIVAVGSLIAVLFSKSKFRVERRRKKKVAAYERIIKAFQDLNKFANEQIATKEQGHEVDEVREIEFRKLETKAKDEIFRAFNLGKFMLSDQAIEILGNYEMASANAPRQYTWYEHIESIALITNKYVLELKNESHKDLTK